MSADGEGGGDRTGDVKAPPRHGFSLFTAYLLLWALILYGAKRVYDSWHLRPRRRFKWFGGQHPEKDAYEAAICKVMNEANDNAGSPAAAGNEDGIGSNGSDHRAGESVAEKEERLRKLLLRRAMTDFRRLVQLSTERDSLYSLMRSGAVSEALWSDFKHAEKEMQVEVFDVQAEAEGFKPGWGGSIMRDAAELVRREDELNKLKREREMGERKKALEEKKAARAREHEERMRREQEERAARMRERLLRE